MIHLAVDMFLQILFLFGGLKRKLNQSEEFIASLDTDANTREKRSAHACLPCFRREFAIEIIRDIKTN